MSKETNYGKYSIPSSIKRLMKINENLKKTKGDRYRDCGLGYIGMELVTDYSGYFITPSDVIVFAETGGDGIHFGFLTDFGAVKDLEEAPIVCVSPTNDPPLKIVARNIYEFLSLVCVLNDAEGLDDISSYENEEDLLSYINEHLEYLKDDEEQHKIVQMIISKIKEEFNLRDISNLFNYWSMIKKERQSKCRINTLDGIGIKTEADVSSYKQYDFSKTDLNSFLKYLSYCTYEEKLGFFRDIQYAIIINSKENTGIRNLVIGEMKKIGLIDEALRLDSLEIID